MNVQETISSKLKATFEPSHLEVINESSNHNVPEGSESHFKVVIVSDKFNGQMLIKRHMAVNECLKDELQNKIHALSIHTFTLEEWAKKEKVSDSPPCLSGSKT